MTEPVVEYYREAGSLAPVDGERTPADVEARSRTCSAASPGPDDHPQGPRRSTASHVPATSWPRRSPTSASTSSRDHHGRARRHRRRVHRRAGRVSASKGYKGYPAEICISPNDMVVHGIPGRTASGRRPDHDRRRRGARRCDRGQCLHLRVGSSTRSRSDCSTSARTRLRPGSPRPPGQPHRRHLARRPDRRRRRRLRGRAQPRRPRRRPSYHEDPQVPNFGKPGRGTRLSPGMTIAIEPMITIGSPSVRARRTGGRSRPTTARSRRISSTRSRSRTGGPGS